MSVRQEKALAAAGLEIRRVPLTAKQKAVGQKMLAAPCPYCSDPKKFQRELEGKGRKDHVGGIARVGKFWKRDDAEGMLTVTSFDHGDYFRIPISGENFIARFKDFNLDIISFEAQYSAWNFAPDSLLFNLSAAPSDIARFNRFCLNVARVTHKKSSVVVDSHTWFSHGAILTIHHVPSELSSTDITVMQEALEFFRPETRGAPKFSETTLVKAIQKLGADATQAQVAKEIGTSPVTLKRWAAKRNKRWQDLKNGYLQTELW